MISELDAFITYTKGIADENITLVKKFEAASNAKDTVEETIKIVEEIANRASFLIQMVGLLEIIKNSGGDIDSLRDTKTLDGFLMSMTEPANKVAI